MNSRRNPRQEEMFDIKLRNYLKNWAAFIDPPSRGKDRLLLAAMRQSKSMQIKKRSILFLLFRIEFDERCLVWQQNSDFVFSTSRYNRFVIDFGFDPRMSMTFS